MRIGIDVREFKKGKYTGLRTILTHFLGNLPSGKYTYDLVFFGNQYTDLDSIPCSGKKVILNETSTLLWDQYTLPLYLKKEKVDLFFSPYIKTPFYRSCVYVNTVCDIIPLVRSKYNGIFSFLEKAHFYLVSFICSRRSTMTVTLSENSKKLISKWLFLRKDRVKVVYPSVDKPAGTSRETVSKECSQYTPYLLYVGNFKKHKNVFRLIEAYGKLPEGIRNEYRLMLVGGSLEECENVNSVIYDMGLTGKVLTVSNVRHSDINDFMGKASVFVFPSLAEGFGIPPVEAMTNGVAVLASNLPPMTEVLGDAALFFDPFDADDIAEKITRVLTEPPVKADLEKKSLEQAALFNPEKMSEKMFDVLISAGKEKDLCVTSEYPPILGGIATQLFNLWNYLDPDATLILTGQTKNTCRVDSRIEITRRRYPLGGDMFSRVCRTILLFFYVWKINRFRNVKCNHCAQIFSAGLVGLLMKKIRKTPYIVYVYSADLLEFSSNAVSRGIITEIIKNADNIIANSEFTGSLVGSIVSGSGDKVTVLTPSIDVSKFSPDVSRDDARRELDLALDKNIILTVARVAKRKGHDKMINVIGKLVEKGENVLYVIAGDGPEKEKIRELVAEKGLGGNVVFAGKIEQEKLVYYYYACDIFAMVPDSLKQGWDSEGFGIVFLEAAACVKPVVAGSTGGVKEAVVDGVTGILVDPDNEEEIEGAISRLMTDKVYADKLGKAGRERVERDFNAESRVEKLRSLV